VGGPEAELNDTVNTQPALLTHSVAVLQLLQAMLSELKPAFVAGHSMGQLSASLVAAVDITLRACSQLARRRGEMMKKAGRLSPGGMAAVLGSVYATLERLCIEASNAR